MIRPPARSQVVTEYDAVRWVALTALMLTSQWGAANDTWTRLDLSDPRLAIGSGSSSGAQVPLGHLWTLGSVYLTGVTSRYAATDVTTPLLVGVRGSGAEIDYTGLVPPGYAASVRVRLPSPVIDLYYSQLDVTGSIYLQLGILRRSQVDPCP